MNPISGLFQRLRSRRSHGSLLELDDRMLNDIGLTRSDVMSLINGKSSLSRRGK